MKCLLFTTSTFLLRELFHTLIYLGLRNFFQEKKKLIVKNVIDTLSLGTKQCFLDFTAMLHNAVVAVAAYTRPRHPAFQRGVHGTA